DFEVRVGTDGEERAGARRAQEEFPVWHAIALVQLDGDPALDAEIDEPLLPLLGIDALGVAERLKRGERRVAEDVDAVAVDPVGDDLERPLEDSFLQLRIGKAFALLPGLEAALHERARVVVPDEFPVELDLMDRADHVMQRLAGRRTDGRSDPEVVLETDAEPEARRVRDVSLGGIFIRELVAPRVVVGDAVRSYGDTLCPIRERDRPVGTVAVDVT